MVILDDQGDCCGYGCICFCLLFDDEDGFFQGWCLGFLMVDSIVLVGVLLDVLFGDCQGLVFIDVLEVN